MRLHLVLILAMTFALGICVAASFFLVGGSLVLRGPFVGERSWLLIYPLQAVLVAAVLFVVARALSGRLALPGLVLVIDGRDGLPRSDEERDLIAEALRPLGE